ncbi:hypothetical protein Bbelb_026620 [Branchiostoma belcheri]|nr:hypothetical protein Bbelb_026620 [Branchiostoma belcheri]
MRRDAERDEALARSVFKKSDTFSLTPLRRLRHAGYSSALLAPPAAPPASSTSPVPPKTGYSSAMQVPPCWLRLLAVSGFPARLLKAESRGWGGGRGISNTPISEKMSISDSAACSSTAELRFEVGVSVTSALFQWNAGGISAQDRVTNPSSRLNKVSSSQVC